MHLSVLVNSLGVPLGIGLMEWIKQDPFKKLGSGIFSHPTGVQDSQGPTVMTSMFLCYSLKAPGELHLVNIKLVTSVAVSGNDRRGNSS